MSVEKPAGTPKNAGFAFCLQPGLPAAGTEPAAPGVTCTRVCDARALACCPKPQVPGMSPIRATLIRPAGATPGKEPTRNFSSPNPNLYPALKHG